VKNKPFKKPFPVKSIVEPLTDEVIAERNEAEKEQTNYKLADVLFSGVKIQEDAI
jgi:hypothetical protein